MEESKMTTQEIDDGKGEVHLKINGENLITLHEAGYKSLGMTYEQAKMFAQNLANLIIAAHHVTNPPETIVEEFKPEG